MKIDDDNLAITSTSTHTRNKQRKCCKNTTTTMGNTRTRIQRMQVFFPDKQHAPKFI